MMYIIYELTPRDNNEIDHRFVEAFDSRKDAQKVLDVLESVNYSFNTYEISEQDSLINSTKTHDKPYKCSLPTKV